MNDTCLGSVQMQRIRVARLNDDGSPKTGEDNLYVSDAPISVASNPNIEKGDEFTQKNGAGIICQYALFQDFTKNQALSMDLCSLDAELLEMLTGGNTLTSGGDTIGYAAPSSVTQTPLVSFEAWTKAWDNTAQATALGDLEYWHFVWPATRWTVGNYTLENAILKFPLTGVGLENDGLGTGPGTDLPSGIAGSWAAFVDSNIPDPSCGYQELVIAGS